MPTMERPPTRNTMAKSASVGTARRAISWIVRLAALPAVEIGGVDAIRWSMSYLAFDFDVHVCTCKRNARRLLIYVPVSYTHLRAHETPEHLVCRLLLEKKK